MSTARHPAAGAVQPTVAGRPPIAWSNAADARAAFTRQDPEGRFTAVLQDASWLRFEGTPEDVESRRRAYFVEGYTTFDVSLVTDDFTKATDETFVLEDSAGRRVVGRPMRYESELGSGREGFAASFELSFRHAITQDTRWIRVTREADGAVLEWRF